MPMAQMGITQVSPVYYLGEYRVKVLPGMVCDIVFMEVI